jgi:hypothetical protein
MLSLAASLAYRLSPEEREMTIAEKMLRFSEALELIGGISQTNPELAESGLEGFLECAASRFPGETWRSLDRYGYQLGVCK